MNFTNRTVTWMMMMMMIDVKWAKRPPNVMKRSQR